MRLNAVVRWAAYWLLLWLAMSSTAAPAFSKVRNVCPGPAPHGHASSAGGTRQAPLVVGQSSHVVVMEYEAWFGPHTGEAPQASVETCLQSANMQALGGGYDSGAPDVIAQHAAWLVQMGVDAATLDLSNNVSCIFDGDNAAILTEACPDAAFRARQLAIRNTVSQLYGAWAALGTPLKILPLVGGFDAYALTPDKDDPRHRTALEKEIEYFGRRMAAYPNLSVVYNGKKLMLIYLGTPVDAHRERLIRDLLTATGLDRRYEFRLIAGYLDSQSAFWKDPGSIPTGPIEIAPKYGFWSVGDRLNFWGAPPAPYYPTYSKINGAIENMTVSIATAGQTGWQCTTAPDGYCPDAALRYCRAGFQNGCDTGVYETLGEFMAYAGALRPIFLIIDQFNEFVEPDEGRTANSNDDLEPTQQWGYSGLRAMIEDVRAYRLRVGKR